MPLNYLTSSEVGTLKQGEILTDIWELRSTHPASEPKDEVSVPYLPIHHPLMIVLTAACDLEQDFGVRFPADSPPASPELEAHGRSLMYVLLSDLHTEGEIKPRLPGSDILRRVRRNQDERYHALDEGPIDGSEEYLFPESLYVDFLKTVALPTAGIYEAIATRAIGRKAVVPPVYIHDLIQRYYSFLARVGILD